MTLSAFQKHDYDTLIAWIDTEKVNLLWGGPVFSFPLDGEQLDAHYERSDVHAFMFIHQGRDVGYVELVRESASLWRICRVFIAPEFSGRGLSKLMLEELILLAKQRIDDLKEIKLAVFEHNTAAIALYESLGFTKYGESDLAQGEQAWRLLMMHLQLS